MALSAPEQYLLELINRARLDPEREALRYGLDLNAGLAAGAIDSSAKQVLAASSTLERAAIDHSNWLLDENVFSHEGENGSNPGDRMAAAGYKFSGQWIWRENLAWSGSTGSIDLTAMIEAHHEGLYLSAHHRENLFAPDVREIGIAQETGQFTQDGTTYNSSMLTENYAKTGTAVFITGVAYDDTDGDRFYSVGEGLSGYTVQAEDTYDKTAAAGGYEVAVSGSEMTRTTILLDGQVQAVLDIDTSDGNAKLDIVHGVAGGAQLELSKSANLISGMSNARLLGVEELDLTGSDDHSHLIGNRSSNVIKGGDGGNFIFGEDGNDRLVGGNGRDWLFGQTGNDVLLGGAGDDRLNGGDGADVLEGGIGDDVLTGGEGADVFAFESGQDQIVDFQNNIDKIQINTVLFDTFPNTAYIMSMGEVVDGNAVFDFGGGDALTIYDVTDLGILENDFLFL